MSKKSDSLRRKAEEIIKIREEIPDKTLMDQNVDKLIEELSIYQVELELQNEELLEKQLLIEQSRKNFQILFDEAPNGYLVVDLDFKIVECNKTALKLLGLPKSKVLNTSVTKYIHPDYQDQVYLKCNSLKSDREPASCEIQLLNSEGHWFYCRMDATIQKDEEGRSFIRISMIDITEQKESSEKIIFQAKMLNTVGNAVIATDNYGKIVFFNQAAEKIYKWKAKEVLGKSILEVTPTNQSKEEAREIMDALMKGERWEGQFEVKDRTGRIFPVHVTDEPILNEEGELIGIIGTSSDISEIISAKEKIEKLALERISMLESIRDGFFVLDKDTVVRYFNVKAEKLLGRKRKDVLNKPLFETFPEAKGSVFEEMYMKGIREQAPIEFETYFEVEPYQNWFNVRVYPNNGGITVFFEVITEKKNLEIELQDKSEEIAVQNEELSAQNEELISQNESYASLNEELKKVNAELQQLNKKLIQNEEFLERVEEMAKLGGWEINLDEDTVSWSKGTKIIHEVDYDYMPSLHEAIGFFPDEGEKIIENAVKLARYEGKNYDLELKFRTAKGNEKWVRTKGVSEMKKGKCVRLSGTIQDITERIKAQQILMEAQLKYRQIFESSRDGYVMVNTKGEFLDANSSYCKMLGYTLDELKKKKDFFEITPEKWRKWEDEEVWQKVLLEKGFSGVYEKEYIRKDGTIFPVELQSYSVKDEKGNIKYLWGIARDITEKKKKDDELRKHSEKLEDLVKERTRELEEKNEKLEHFNKLFVGREFRIKELRDKVKELELKLHEK